MQAMLERSKEKDASKALVSLMLSNSEDGEIRQKLIRNCHINFGTGRLNDLTRPQLQLAMSWLDQQPHYDGRSATLPDTTRLKITDLLRAYPKETGLIFIFGAVIGALIF